MTLPEDKGTYVLIAFDHDRPFEREFEGVKRFESISRSDPSQVAILHVGRGERFFYYVMELADPVVNPKFEGRQCRGKSEFRMPKSGTNPKADGGSGSKLSGWFGFRNSGF